jgi:co-chaperonin GroES (HSP10)
MQVDETMVEPLHDVIVGQEIQQGEVVSGRIIVPNNATLDTPVVHALVLAAGDGAMNSDGKILPNPIEVSQVVMFLRASAFQFWDTNGKRHWMIRANSVVGRIRQ